MVTLGRVSTDGRWLDPDELRVWRQWLDANARLSSALNRELQADGLSLSDFDVLVHLTDALAEHDEARVRVGELARALAWERSRVSHHVSRMEKRGLVSREDCVDDGRGAFVVLTAQGRAAIDGAAPAHADVVRDLVFDGLDRADLAALDRVTRSVLGRIERRHGGGNPERGARPPLA